MPAKIQVRPVTSPEMQRLRAAQSVVRRLTLVWEAAKAARDATIGGPREAFKAAALVAYDARREVADAEVELLRAVKAGIEAHAGSTLSKDVAETIETVLAEPRSFVAQRAGIVRAAMMWGAV